MHALHSMVLITLQAMPGGLASFEDMSLNYPLLSDLHRALVCLQQLVNDALLHAIINFDYQIGQKILKYDKILKDYRTPCNSSQGPF